MKFQTIIFVLLVAATPVAALNLLEWLASDARTELISEFESNDCRLTLTDMSDILFEYDLTDEHVYSERLILMEPEAAQLEFHVVLVKGDVCKNAKAESIDVPEAAISFAKETMTGPSCIMDVATLETLEYPDDLNAKLTESDRRNIVSELYNRDVVTFRYVSEEGVDKLRVHSLKEGCAPFSDGNQGISD